MSESALASALILRVPAAVTIALFSNWGYLTLFVSFFSSKTIPPLTAVSTLVRFDVFGLYFTVFVSVTTPVFSVSPEAEFPSSKYSSTFDEIPTFEESYLCPALTATDDTKNIVAIPTVISFFDGLYIMCPPKIYDLKI